MEIKNNIELNQNISINKKLKNSLDILSMSSSELEEKIREEFLENPILEIKEKFINFDENYKVLRSNKSLNNDNIDYIFNNVLYAEVDFRKDLEMKIYSFMKDKNKIKYCINILYNIDNDGYIRCFDKLPKELNINYDYLEECLIFIQNIEQNGIGARTLSECLMIQLKKQNIYEEIYENIVVNDLELIAKNKLELIAKKYDKNLNEIIEIIDKIKKLNPRPVFICYENKYISADLSVKKTGDLFIVKINKTSYPNIVLNKHYVDILKNSKDEKLKKYLAEKLNSYKELVNNILKRNNTLLKITEEIVNYQKEGFEKGFNYLKPLTMKYISKKLSMHESTVSRAIKEKYVETDFGVVTLKSFFVHSIKKNDDKTIIKIKELIVEIIQFENKNKPFSDEKISKILKENDIDIARRTVTKYREELKIQSSSKRKKFK